MRTKCASVRVESFHKISDKAYLLRSFDGREAIIPASQFYGYDNDVSKSDAWIMKEIGMDADELLRFKQLSGLAEMFKDRNYSTTEEI